MACAHTLTHAHTHTLTHARTHTHTLLDHLHTSENILITFLIAVM